MTAELVQKRLEDLADLRAKAATITDGFQKKRDKLFKPIEKKLADINAAQATAIKPVAAEIDKAEAEIRAAVIPLGESVKGDRLQAIFIKGGVRWDASYLAGLAETMPAIAKARTELDPTVQIRVVKPAASAE